MALPLNGAISMLDVQKELGDDISVPELNPSDYDYFFTSEKDFYDRIEQICIENNQDLSNKTIGFSNDVLALTPQSFDGTFPNKLIKTPKAIYSNNLLVLDNVFYNCKLLYISPELFKNCQNVRSINDGFRENRKLTYVPKNLFDNLHKLYNVDNCFYNNDNVTSDIPELWNKEKYPYIINHKDYAWRCTKASNYSVIPSDWK